MAYDLKKPEEVKEYLKNLSIEYQFGCYHEKRPEVCHLLADFKEAIKKEFTEAAKLYKSNCDKTGYGRSCTKYGDYSLIGKGCEKNIKTAYEYMVKGCDQNEAKGCYHAGVVGVSDELGEENRKIHTTKGVEMLRKACYEQNFESACFYLTGVYLRGIDGYVEKNLLEAYKLSLKSCENGNPLACANVSQMHARGDGVQKNPDLAQAFKQRALDLRKELQSTKSSINFQQGIAP